MLVIDLKGLGKEVESAVNYLSKHVDEPLRLKDGRVSVTSINAHSSKLMIHKFLKKQRLEDYRVIVSHPGLVQVSARRPRKKRPTEERPNLFPKNETIPYYQVAAEMGGIVPKPGRRKWRP